MEGFLFDGLYSWDVSKANSTGWWENPISCMFHARFLTPSAYIGGRFTRRAPLDQKQLGCSGYIGDYIAQLFISTIMIPTKQPGFHGKALFFCSWLTRTTHRQAESNHLWCSEMKLGLPTCTKKFVLQLRVKDIFFEDGQRSTSREQVIKWPRGWLNLYRGDNDYPVNMWKKAIPAELTSIYWNLINQGCSFTRSSSSICCSKLLVLEPNMTTLTGRLAFQPVPREELWFKWTPGRSEAASTYGVKDAETGKHPLGRSWITRSSAILERRSRSDEELMTMALEVRGQKHDMQRSPLRLKLEEFQISF